MPGSPRCDVGGGQEEADRHQLLGAPLGRDPGQAGSGEPPDHDDAGHGLDAAVRLNPSRATGPAGQAEDLRELLTLTAIVQEWLKIKYRRALAC